MDITSRDQHFLELILFLNLNLLCRFSLLPLHVQVLSEGLVLLLQVLNELLLELLLLLLLLGLLLPADLINQQQQ